MRPPWQRLQGHWPPFAQRQVLGVESTHFSQFARPLRLGAREPPPLISNRIIGTLRITTRTSTAKALLSWVRGRRPPSAAPSTRPGTPGGLRPPVPPWAPEALRHPRLVPRPAVQLRRRGGPAGRKAARMTRALRPPSSDQRRLSPGLEGCAAPRLRFSARAGRRRRRGLRAQPSCEGRREASPPLGRAHGLDGAPLRGRLTADSAAAPVRQEPWIH